MSEQKTSGFAALMVPLILSLLVMGLPSGGALGTSSNEKNSSSACQVGYFGTNVTETNGTLIIQCNQVGWTQLTGYPSGCSANQFVTAVGATLTCSTVSYTGLTNFPTGCSAGQFVTGVGVTLTCSSVAWTQITSFPTGCALGQFVTAVGSSLTCSLVPVFNFKFIGLTGGVGLGSFTPPSGNNGYEVGCSIDVIAFTAGTIACKVTWTDPNNQRVNVIIVTASALNDAPGQSVTIFANGSASVAFDAVATAWTGTYDITGFAIKTI